MAETLPNGAVVPDSNGGETISATGVQEIRTLGASVDAGLGNRATIAQLNTKADQSTVTGMMPRLFFRGSSPLGTNYDDWYMAEHAGMWSFSQSSAATQTGLPPGRAGQAGQILVMANDARTAMQMHVPYGYHSTQIMTRFIANITTREWSEWEPVGGSGGGATIDPMVQHSIRQAMFMSAMGGPIDTGGLGAVAFRFDHGLANFKNKVLPLTTARGIKVSQAYNPRNWHYDENQGVTPSELNSWVAAGDVEIWNHSANHQDVDGEAALTDVIAGGLAEIEAELPAARGNVWGFNPPGVDGTTGWGGFGNGSTPEKWDTIAGRLILQYHAVSSAYLPGTSIRPLDGAIRDGQTHVTMDTRNVAYMKERIDAAISQRGGLQVMLHPSLLDTSGRMTTAQFAEVLDYAVEKRDAGELVILSPYEMAVADSTGGGDVDADAALAAYQAIMNS